MRHPVEADVAIVGARRRRPARGDRRRRSRSALTIALVSKVYPMRSHTVAAEGGAAGVTQRDDSLDAPFQRHRRGRRLAVRPGRRSTTSSRTAHEEMVQLEHWGCPWSRKADGHVNVRAFGGMKIERTWFAADKTGFHMLHTLFQTSIKYPSIRRFDEHFCVDLIVEDGRVQRRASRSRSRRGEFSARSQAKAVIIATGGAGRVFRENTNGGIVTGDGMALAYRARRAAARHGVRAVPPDLHAGHRPAVHRGLPRRRRLPAQQGRLSLPAGLRPRARPIPWPRNKAMELGPARPAVAGLLARGAEGPHHRHARTARRCTSTCATSARRSCASACRRSTSSRDDFLGIDPAQGADSRSARRCTTRWAASATDGALRVAAARPVRGGRMLERRHPRRQPARLELAGRARRVRQGGGRSRPRAMRAARRRRRAVASRQRRREDGRPRAAVVLDARRRGERLATLRDEMARQHGSRLRHLPHGTARCRRPATSSRSCSERYRAGVRLDDRSQRLEHRMAAGHRARLPCSTWRRRWRIRRSSAANRAARTSGSTASRRATTPISSSTRSRLSPATGAPRIELHAGEHHALAARHARLRRRRRSRRTQ